MTAYDSTPSPLSRTGLGHAVAVRQGLGGVEVQTWGETAGRAETGSQARPGSYSASPTLLAGHEVNAKVQSPTATVLDGADGGRISQPTAMCARRLPTAAGGRVLGSALPRSTYRQRSQGHHNSLRPIHLGSAALARCRGRLAPARWQGRVDFSLHHLPPYPKRRIGHRRHTCCGSLP
jgi:hypothetical protein